MFRVFFPPKKNNTPNYEIFQSILGERNVLREKINSAETASERSILLVCIANMRTAKGNHQN